MTIKRIVRHDGMASREGSIASFADSGSSFDSLPPLPPRESSRDSSLSEANADAVKAAAIRAALREAGLWYQLDHVNIIKMYAACLDASPPLFVCELAPGGDLSGTLRKNREQGRYDALNVIWTRLLEAARGVQYLHRKGIVHGDLKGNNIVVGADGVAKLIDFGSSFFASEGQPEKLRGIGPADWMAPECFRLRERSVAEATFASDIYSFGVCIVETMSGEPPFGDFSNQVVRYHASRGTLPLRPRDISDNE